MPGARERPIMSTLAIATIFFPISPYAIYRAPQRPVSSPESQMRRIERQGRGPCIRARAIGSAPALPEALSSAALKIESPAAFTPRPTAPSR